MAKTDRSDITKELLEEYVKKGYSQHHIATELGIAQSTLTYRLKKYNLQTKKTKPSSYDEKTLIKQLKNGWTTEQIAEYFDVCAATVSHWIRKHDLGKYRKTPVHKYETADCKTCMYRSREKTASNRCNYLFITGHSRNKGQPENGCSKYVKGGREHAKRTPLPMY